MKLTISPRAEKQFKKLPKVSQIIIAKKIRSLLEIDLHQTQSLQIKSYKNVYRVRVGDYRIVFKKSSREVYIVLIGHRKDVYQRLERLFK